MKKKSLLIGTWSFLGGAALATGVILPITMVKKHNATATLPPSDNLGKVVASFEGKETGFCIGSGVTYCETAYFSDARIHFDVGDPSITIHVKTTGGTCWDGMLIDEGDYTFTANHSASDCYHEFYPFGYSNKPFKWEIKAKKVKRDGNTAKFRLDTWEGPPYDSDWSWGDHNNYCDMSAMVI